MRPSLRFSILALLSKSKFNIFNSGLIQFMDMLNGGGWNKDNTQSEYGAYVIDHINLFNDLDYKDDSNSKLIDAFDKVRNDKEISNEFLRV